MVEGFDLGNSPPEFIPEQVAGKRLVMATTNGTRAFLMVGDAARVIACSFTNLEAVAREVSDVDYLVVVCAGRAGMFSLDDAVCAGVLMRRVCERQDGDLEFNDAGMAAMELANTFRVNADFLASTWSGQRIVEIGLREDLELCAQIDRHAVVPEMDDLVIRVRSPEPDREEEEP
jgi:2-phosphosulfolactate phosphatase